MSRVYIIFEGDYSNKHVVKCFSTKSAAEEYKKKLIKEDKERRAEESRREILELRKPSNFDKWKKVHPQMQKKHWGMSHNIVLKCFHCRNPVVYDVTRDIVVNALHYKFIDTPVLDDITKLEPHEPICFETWLNERIKCKREYAEADYDLYELECYDLE